MTFVCSFGCPPNNYYRTNILGCPAHVLVAWANGQDIKKSPNSRGGYSPLENGIRVRADLKTPFSRPPDRSLRPLFHNYTSFSRLYIRLKSQIFGKFAFQSLKIVEKFSSVGLKFEKISVPRASNGTKNQFFKTPNFAAVRSLCPYFLPFGLHTHES